MNFGRKVAPKSSVPKQNCSNANLSSIRQSTSTLNRTIFGARYTPAVYTPEQMDKMEMNFQKHAAALACFQKFTTDQMVAEQEAASIEHLIRLDNKATQVKLQEAELENQIAIMQSNKVAKERVDQLQSQVFESKKFLTTQVKRQVESLLHLMNSASNKLYLAGNVSKLEQEDFTAIEELMEKCSVLIKELLKRAENKDGLKDIVNDIKFIKEKQKEVQHYLEVLRKLDNVIGQTTLRVLSDEMAKIL